MAFIDSPVSSTQDLPLTIGRTTPHYHIVEKLSGGSMGVMYKANVTRPRFAALTFPPDEVAGMSLRFKQH
jgi:hypothetical protein